MPLMKETKQNLNLKLHFIFHHQITAKGLFENISILVGQFYLSMHPCNLKKTYKSVSTADLPGLAFAFFRQHKL